MVASPLSGPRGPLPRPRASRPRRATRYRLPAGSNRTIFQYARAMHSRTHRCAPEFQMFQHDTLFAISTRCSRSRGHLAGGFEEGDIAWVLRPAAVSSAYLWSSARCLAALGTSPTCEQAGSAGFTVSGRIAIGPIACIVTSTDWCASSGTNSDIADRLPSLLRAHQNCDGSGRFCQKMVAIRFHRNSRSHPGAPLRAVRPGLNSRRRQARRGALQSRRGKPAQKRGIIPTPAR